MRPPEFSQEGEEGRDPMERILPFKLLFCCNDQSCESHFYFYFLFINCPTLHTECAGSCTLDVLAVHFVVKVEILI